MYNVTSVKEAESVVEALQAIADAIPPANPVPDVTSADDGKVLKATYSGGEGSYDWEDESGGVPSTVGHNLNEVLIIEDTTTTPPTADWNALDEVLPNMSTNNYPSNGDIIAYNSSTHKAEWQTPQSGGGVPDYSGASVGDVLTITEDKSGNFPAWVTPSGGSSTITRLASYNVSFTSDGGGHAVTTTNAYEYYTQFIGNGYGLNAYVVFSNVNQTAEIRIVPITYCVLDKDTYIGFDESLLPTSYNDCSLYIIYYNG